MCIGKSDTKVGWANLRKLDVWIYMLAGCGGAGEGGPGKGGTRGGLLGLIISGYADMIRSSARGSKSFVRFFGYFRYVIELQMQLTIFIIKVNGCIDVALVCICMEFVWSS